MSEPKKSIRTALTALSAISALVAVWQFYLFVQFRNAAGGVDPEGGTHNLWLAVAATLVACAAGAYVVFSAVTHDGEDVMHITS